MATKRPISTPNGPSQSGLLLEDGPWLKLVGATGSMQNLIAPSSLRRLINHNVTVSGRYDSAGIFVVTHVRTG
jgi:hypothetical protein